MKKSKIDFSNLNSYLSDFWKKNKQLFNRKNIEFKKGFENDTEIIMYYLRSVVTFNVKKTSFG